RQSARLDDQNFQATNAQIIEHRLLYRTDEIWFITYSVASARRFLHHHQLRIGPQPRGKDCSSPFGQPRIGGGGYFLTVLGIIIDAVEDNEVVAAAEYEKQVIMKKPAVAGAKIVAFHAPGYRAAKDRIVRRFPPPISLRDARATQRYGPQHPVRQLLVGLRINNNEITRCARCSLPTSYQNAIVLLRFLAEIAPHISLGKIASGKTSGAPFQRTVNTIDKKGRFRKPVTRQECLR